MGAPDDLTPLVEPRFVGEGRRRVVDGLLAAFDGVNHGEGPLWVVLEAPSGTGKTRIARELYARLAAERQHSGPYWPPSVLGPEAAGSDVAARRKRVFPRVEHVPGTLPSFWWWGIAAAVRNGEPSSALAEDVGQLEAHAPYLDDAWRRLASWSERNGEWWRRPLGDVSQEVVTELAGRALEAAVGLAAPGLGLVFPLVESLRARRARARERAERLAGSATVAADGTDLVDETVATLTRLARPGLPVVVFVEDAHAADPVLAELLGRLVASDGAVLVVTTQWPGHGEANAALAAAVAQRPDRVVVASSEDEALPAPFPPGASLAALAPDDRAELVRHYYPRVDPATLDLLVARYVNPLALELFCLLGRYRERFPDGDLRLPASEVERLPQTVQDLYRDLWRELPREVRRALTLASLGIPAAIDPGASSDLAWHQPLLLRTLVAARVAPADDVATTLETAPTTRAWARLVDDALRRFHEADQLRIAHQDDEFLFDSDREEFRAELARQVHAALEASSFAGVAEAAHAARLGLALHAQGFGTDDGARRAAVVLLGALAEQPRELPTRLAVAERALALPGTHRGVELTLRYQHAVVLMNLGRVADALPLWAELFEELTEDPDAAPEVVLAVWTNVAMALDEIGRTEAAVQGFEAVARAATELHGRADHPEVLAARANAAVGLERLGRTDEALGALREVLDARRAALGEDHVHTLHTRLRIGWCLVNLGRAAEAHREAVDLAEAAVRVLGADHPLTLDARDHLASTSRLMDRGAEALVVGDALVADHERVFGPRHPQTVRARSNRAVSLALTGAIEEAEAERRALVALGTDVMGADHPDVLQLRMLLANLLLEDDRAAEALPELEAVQAASVRLLGADHPRTLLVRRLVPAALGRVGRGDEALALVEELLADSGRVLGAEHSGTLEVATLRAELLEEAGRGDTSAPGEPV